MSYRFKKSILIACVVGVWCGTGVAQQGTVVDQTTGKPIAKAWVMHRPSWALVMTNEQGEFVFPDILPLHPSIRSMPFAQPLPFSADGQLRLPLGMPEPFAVQIKGARLPLTRVHSDTYRLPSLRQGLVTVLIGSLVYRGVSLGQGGSLVPIGQLSKSAPSSISARTAATAESLIVSRYGYDPAYVPVTVKNVGAVKLTPNTKAPPPGMRELKGGAFKMGSSRNATESPIHDVTVSGFYIDTTEVTQADYELLMGETPWKRDANGYDLTFGPRFSALQMTWFEAALYCNQRSKRDGLDTVFTYSGKTPEPRLGFFILNDLKVNIHAKGYRLPTEAEWEYGCKGGQDSIYHWGRNKDIEDSAKIYGWYNHNVRHTGNSITNEAVATKKPNQYGLYDMAGNAAEHVLDSRISPYPLTPNVDPFFEDKAIPPNRIDKSGGFLFTSEDMSCSTRGSGYSYDYGSALGFRVVLPIR